jgi:hypothetical protein
VLAQSASEVAAALLSQGLAEMRYGFAGPDARTTFVPTAKGLRLRKLVPPNPVSVTDFWV